MQNRLIMINIYQRY